MVNKNSDWLDKTEYPFTSQYTDAGGANQHFIDVGMGDTILFVHGTPSWSFDFRQVIKELSHNYRCIALDHIGFGLSDKPAHYDYSVRNHALNLCRFIEEKQLKNITLVMHDFGGPIGFHYAINNPGNVKSLVVMNSWIGSSKNDPDFIKFSRILRSPLLPFLYLYLNFSPKYLLPQSFGEHKISGKLLTQYTKPFRRKSERYGVLAFARSLLKEQEWFEDLWNARGVLNKHPMLLIWGMGDRFVTGKYLERFSVGFPNAITKKIDGCGHFPQEEQPALVSNLLAEFLKIGVV